MSFWRQQNNSGVLDLEILDYRSNIRKKAKIMFPIEQDTEYLDNINNALDFFDLPLTEQVTYKFNKSVNPTPKRVVILLRKK